jgi:hypothetical protein
MCHVILLLSERSISQVLRPCIALWEEGRSMLRPYSGWPCRYETDL